MIIEQSSYYDYEEEDEDEDEEGSSYYSTSGDEESYGDESTEPSARQATTTIMAPRRNQPKPKLVASPPRPARRTTTVSRSPPPNVKAAASTTGTTSTKKNKHGSIPVVRPKKADNIVRSSSSRRMMGALSWRTKTPQTTAKAGHAKQKKQEKRVFEEIRKDSREYMLEDSGDSFYVDEDDDFEQYDDNSYGDERLERGVIAAPSRATSDIIAPSPRSAFVGRDRRTTIPSLHQQKEIRDKALLEKQEDHRGPSSSSDHDDDNTVGTFRSVTPTAILLATKKNEKQSNSRRLSRMPTLPRMRTKDRSSSLKSSKEMKERKQRQQQQQQQQLITPTSYFYEEFGETNPAEEKSKKIFAKVKKQRGKKETSRGIKQVEREPRVSVSDIIQEDPQEERSPTPVEEPASTTKFVPPAAPSCLAILANVLFLGEREQCAHCHESVYKESSHMRQYPYADESSRFQYLHVNCHADRAKVEQRMALVREEFQFLNQRFQSKQKEQIEAQKEHLAQKKKKRRGSSKKHQAQQPSTQQQSGRKWNTWRVTRKERK